MDIKSLRYFISVARHLNFTKAAKECNITQTAMSLHISKLEDELGFLLFSRNNRNVMLTEGGRVFYEESKKILSNYDKAVGKAYSASLGFEGNLRVGSSNYPDSIYFSEYVRAFHQQYPKVKIESVMATDIHTPEGFYAHKLDVGICLPYDLQVDSDIQLIQCARRPLRFVLHPSHPMARFSRLNPAYFEEEHFFIMRVNHLRHTFDHIGDEWKMCGIDPKRLIEVDSFDNILFMVSAGLGVGLLPYYFKETQTKEFVVIEAEGDLPSADLALAYSVSSQNPVTKLFIDLVEKNKQQSVLTS